MHGGAIGCEIRHPRRWIVCLHLFEQMVPLRPAVREIRIDNDPRDGAAFSCDGHITVFGHGEHHLHRVRGREYPAFCDQGSVALERQVCQRRQGVVGNPILRVRNATANNDGVGRRGDQ